MPRSITRPTYRGNLASAALLALLAAAALLVGVQAVQAAHVEPTVIATIPLNDYPGVVGLNPVSNRIYVGSGGVVRVIDGSTNSVTASIPVNGDAQQGGIATNPVTNRVYVTLPFDNTRHIHTGEDALVVIDGATNTVVNTVDVGRGPRHVGVNPVTNRVYVANFYGGSVSVVDGATNTTIATIPVPSRPGGAAVDPTTNRIYVTSNDADNVSVIDGASNAVIATIPVGDGPFDAAVNPETARVYVNNLSDGTVSVIDATSNTVLTTVIVGSQPLEVAVNPVTNRVYISHFFGSNTVSVIDASTNSVMATVAVASFPYGIAANSSTDRVYVANVASQLVSVIGEALADLSLSMTDSPDPIAVTRDLTYTLTVTNNGPSPATGVTLADSLPATVTFSSATSTQGACTHQTGTVSCSLGTLARGASATVSIVVIPNVGDTITNTASITGEVPDADPGNNAASEDTVVYGPPRSPAGCGPSAGAPPICADQ